MNSLQSLRAQEKAAKAGWSVTPSRQQRALSAYQGGFISIGKLAEVMGMHVLDLRSWLDEHGIAQNTSMSTDDHTNA
jgi:predicted HTH domain antitoxin